MTRIHTGRRTADGRYRGVSYNAGPLAAAAVVGFFLAIWMLITHPWASLLLLGLFVLLGWAMNKMKAEEEAIAAEKAAVAEKAKRDAFLAESQRLYNEVNRRD